MKKRLSVAVGLAIGLSSVQSFAGFADSDIDRAYVNCAYKGKKASKKCLVTNTYVRSSIDPITKRMYGSNEYLSLLTIKWPDGDTSRYVELTPYEVINLNSKRKTGYSVRVTNSGISIDSDNWGRNYIQLW